MVKKILALLLVLAMLITVFAGCKKEDEGTGIPVEDYEYTFRNLPKGKYHESAESFAEGKGTEADPYQISNVNELVYLDVVLNDSANKYDDAYYILTADIALNDVSDFENWQSKAPEYSWKPISDFKGIFNGNGYTISGMYVNTDANKAKEDFGLFESVRGTVKNLTIDKSFISVSGYSGSVGAIAGRLYSHGMFENCISKAVVDCYDSNNGGLIGTVAGGLSSDEYATIKDCRFEGVINQVRETSSLSVIGCIAGHADGDITNCVNVGTVNFNSNSVDTVGGIVGWYGEGEIVNCVNKGNLLDKLDASVGISRVGGIVGNLFLSATGSEKYMSRGATIKDCTNNGTVFGSCYAGGIVGNANNDYNSYCLTIENCINNGEVKSSEKNGYTGGIIGKLICNGDSANGENVIVKNCLNTADISQGTVGGVIGQFHSTKGLAKIEECKNTGKLTTTSLYCAGIISYWLMDSNPDIKITVSDCVNEGTIKSPNNAGGIFCFADSPVILDEVNGTEISVINCKNSGEIISESVNSCIGGISGNWGMKNIPTTFDGCTNSGTLSYFTKAPDEIDLNYDEPMTLSRIVGGIIGRVGEGLLLTTDNDMGKNKNIQNGRAIIKFKNCSNTGTLNVPDAKEYVNVQGEQLYENYFGGIIGNACGEKEFSVYVEECTYSGFERGLGNKNFTDIGTKE